MKPRLKYSNLAEALSWLRDATGRDWTENELLDSAASNRITLHAAPGIKTHANLYEIDLGAAAEEAFKVKYELGWHLALLHPIHLAQIQHSGETETIHAAGETQRPMEYLFFPEAVRVTREQVRISDSALSELEAVSRRQARNSHAQRCASGIDERLTAPTETATGGNARINNDEIQTAIEGFRADSQPDHDAELAGLFDSVRKEQLEAMFPDGGKWAGYAERAARNGLDVAREGRGIFNPYRAALWWLERHAPAGWKWERCARVLANNLPSRSRDSRHLLTGDFD